MTNEKKLGRTHQGTVVSTKMQKTIVVRVDSIKEHPKYLKRFTTSKKFKVHDEKAEAKVGDVVTFVETRPLSKTKFWRLLTIVRKAA